MKSDLKHLALIMDGNGRWAQARNKNRFWGHVKGAEVAQTIVEHCAQKTNIKHLTLYAFSTENWSRPAEEVSFLFKLLDKHLSKKQNYMIENNVKLNVIGNLAPLPHNLKTRIETLTLKTLNNDGLNLTLALNYGGRDELLEAMKNLMVQAQENKINPQNLKAEDFQNQLQTANTPDPDLIIRTSGEMRLSNFMLWQAAYSELYFTNTLWPDFTPKDLEDAISDFNIRNRRFGTIKEDPSIETKGI